MIQNFTFNYCLHAFIGFDRCFSTVNIFLNYLAQCSEAQNYVFESAHPFQAIQFLYFLKDFAIDIQDLQFIFIGFWFVKIFPMSLYLLS
jgi:hypothetical protein